MSERVAREKGMSIALVNRLMQVASEKSTSIYSSQLRRRCATTQLRRVDAHALLASDLHETMRRERATRTLTRAAHEWLACRLRATVKLHANGTVHVLISVWSCFL